MNKAGQISTDTVIFKKEKKVQQDLYALLVKFSVQSQLSTHYATGKCVSFY